MSSAIIKALNVIEEQATRIEELEREVSYLLTREKNNVALIEELEAQVERLRKGLDHIMSYADDGGTQVVTCARIALAAVQEDSDERPRT